jgi:transposase
MPNRRRPLAVLFIGDDWAEAHHDIELVDEGGRRLARRRLPEGVEGLAALHALVADHLTEDAEPDQVLVGIETDRGPWVQALIAAGYLVYAVNPLQVARYRERHSTSEAKSDPGDAHVLAELVRLDRTHHRPVAGDSEVAEHVKVLTRTHQSMIWSRQRQTNALRSMLREFHPGRTRRLRRRPRRPGRTGDPGDRSLPRDRPPTVPKPRSPRCCAGPEGDATPRPPSGSRRRCGPRSWRPTRAWSAPMPPRCARWPP